MKERKKKRKNESKTKRNAKLKDVTQEEATT